jgi:hypothetical protein
MSEDNNKYTGEKKIPKNNKVEKSTGLYRVTFNQRRRFELKIGRRMIAFDSKNPTVVLRKEEIEHPDFIQQRKYFSVVEV